MTIESDLEKNRVEELDHLLTLIKPKILQYIAEADPNSTKYKTSSLGTYHEPAFLKQELINDLDNNLVKPASEDQLWEIIDKVFGVFGQYMEPGVFG